MNIPNIGDLKHPVIESQNGQLTDRMNAAWHRMFTQLVTELQKNVSNEGYVFPVQPQANVNILNTPEHTAKILYDADAQAMKVNNTGTFQEISTRPQELTNDQISAIPADKISGTWVYNTTSNKLLYGIQGVFKEVAFS